MILNKRHTISDTKEGKHILPPPAPVERVNKVFQKEETNKVKEARDKRQAREKRREK